MCKIFRSTGPAAYAAETRAVRLGGYATSIRLEAAFWQMLEEISEHEGMTVNRFVSVLHDEIMEEQGEVKNFASLLRVICLRWSQGAMSRIAARGGLAEGSIAAPPRQR
ncbi:hypothetical protein AcidC75_01670 [Acidisoma sp. C75]